MKIYGLENYTTIKHQLSGTGATSPSPAAEASNKPKPIQFGLLTNLTSNRRSSDIIETSAIYIRKSNVCSNMYFTRQSVL